MKINVAGRFCKKAEPHDTPRALSPVRAAPGLAASGRWHRPAAAAQAPRAADSLSTPGAVALPSSGAPRILVSCTQGLPPVEGTRVARSPWASDLLRQDQVCAMLPRGSAGTAALLLRAQRLLCSCLPAG